MFQEKQTDEKQHNVGIYFIMLLVPIFWGGAFGVAKHVITEISPITAAALRFVPASVILLAIVMYQSDWDTKVLKENLLGLFLMGVTGIFGYNLLFFIALGHTSAINGSLIMALTPVFMTLGAILFLNEVWNVRLGIGLTLSLLGALIVIINGSLATLTSLSFNLGDVLFVAGLACWVAHGLIGKRVMMNVAPLFTTAISTLIGAIMLLVVSFFEGDWAKVGAMSIQAWFEMIFMIICSSVIAFLLWNRGIQKIGASKAGMYMNLVPINATWIAVVFYGAGITWLQLLGMVMVILGVYVATLLGRHHKFS